MKPITLAIIPLLVGLCAASGAGNPPASSTTQKKTLLLVNVPPPTLGATRTYSWGITESAEPDALALHSVGQSGQVTYSITVTRGSLGDAVYHLSGVVKARNLTANPALLTSSKLLVQGIKWVKPAKNCPAMPTDYSQCLGLGGIQICTFASTNLDIGGGVVSPNSTTTFPFAVDFKVPTGAVYAVYYAVSEIKISNPVGNHPEIPFIGFAPLKLPTSAVVNSTVHVVDEQTVEPAGALTWLSDYPVSGWAVSGTTSLQVHETVTALAPGAALIRNRARIVETGAAAETNVTVQANKLNIAIVLDPQVVSRHTTSDVAFLVSGRVLALSGTNLPALVSWQDITATVPRTGTFDVDPSGSFSGTIQLEQGDNAVTFAAGGNDNLASLTVTYNPGYEFGGALTISPDVLYTGEPRILTAKIALTDWSTDPSNVKLVQVIGTTEQEVASLTDDGNLANGDEIQGDRIFTGLSQLVASDAGVIKLRVLAHTTNGLPVRSEVLQVLVTQHLLDSDLHSIISLQEAKGAELEAAAAAGTLRSVLYAMLLELQQLPAVSQAGIGEGTNGIWVVYTNGIAGLIYSPRVGVKGGEPTAAREPYKQVLYPELEAYGPYNSFYAAEHNTPKLSSAGIAAPMQIAALASGTIDSKKALVIAAQYWDWGDNDDIPKIEALLEQACLDVSYIKYTASGAGSVEHFKNLGGYGIVCVSSHGDSYYKGILSLWQDVFGWNGWFGQVVVHSNMRVTDANKVTYEDDLKKGRLVLWGGSYGMTPSFFKTYNGSMPNSLVYMSICRGTWNDTLAKAFLQSGAGAFLGYSDYVAVSFCVDVGLPFFQNFLKPNATVGDAFVPGQKETDSDPAEFRLFGSTSTSLGATAGQLQDGGFESGNISQAWSTSGDARIIPYLGNFAPIEGSRMGVISTGLGFTTSSGSIRQTVCIPDGATTLSFDWNFISEEFLEWCGSIYQDRFHVRLIDEQNQSTFTEVFERHVDMLCGQVFLVDFSFDQPLGSCYATGWQTANVTIPDSYRGKKAIVEFYVTDVGDSIYDTAVLLDAISLQ